MPVKKFDNDYFLKFRHDKKSTGEWQLFYQDQILELQNQKYISNQVKICDVGCGLGSFLGMCDKVGWLTYGIDISEYAIEKAKKTRRTKARLVVCDIKDGIPFEDEFDIVTYFDVVEHLENHEKVLFNINQKLKEGGILLLTTPNLRSSFSKRISGWQEDETHISLRKAREWERCLRNMGFRIICSKTVFPVLSQKRGIKSLVGKLLAAIGFGSTSYLVATKGRKE